MEKIQPNQKLQSAYSTENINHYASLKRLYSYIYFPQLFQPYFDPEKDSA